MAINGKLGIVHPTGKRVRDILGLLRWLLAEPRVSLKALQVCLGLLVHVLQCRRELSGLLHHSWALVGRPGETEWPTVIPAKVRRELCRVAATLPLMRIDLRRAPSRYITASDACESGGGVCRAARLTSWGAVCLERDLGRVFARARDRLAIVTVNEELGSTLAAIELLGVEAGGGSACCASVHGKRLFRCCWPHSEIAEDVLGKNLEKT
jgi:hypothetical protein